MHDGYDIAVIKLDRKANITLPGFDRQGGEFRDGQAFTSLGWGRTRTGSFPDRLQMSEDLIYLPPRRCREEFGYEMEKQMVCAGLINEDICQGELQLPSCPNAISDYVLLLGDLGSPFLIPNRPDGNLTAGKSERDLIIGLTSFGSKDCNGSSPAVYLSIGYFWNWLTSVTDGNVAKVR